MAFLPPGSKSSSAFGFTFTRPRSEDKPGRGPRDAAGTAGLTISGSSSDSSGSGSPVHNPGLEGTPWVIKYRYGDANLPVYKYRKEILYLVQHHATTILVGETGSGKTTQLPQFLYEAGWASAEQCIVCTQPRRVAASNVAARVAEEMGCELGSLVGYAVRFDSVMQEGRTKIKYLTDGVLLREMMDDPLLTKYSVVIVDEAHERSLATDMLLGLIKKVQRRRPDLRLVISSATLEAHKLKDFFDTASTVSGRAPPRAAAGLPSRMPAIITVEGRTHPVQVHYLEAPCADYVRAAVDAAVALHTEDLPGDILIFLTGQEEVQSAVAQLDEHARRLARSKGYSLKMLPLPLYAGLPSAQQRMVFQPTPRGYRKVVAATNIAETSLTLEGVVYVVDCCFVKQRAYNPLTGLESLLVAPLSKASAVQRAGRAGRVRAGHCFRLCTEEAFAGLPEVTVPEMQRSDLAAMTLQLKALGIDNIMQFEWLAPPPAEAMVRALELLYGLGILDQDARLTRDVGLPAASLPLEPPMAVALLASLELGCSEELLTIAAMMSVSHIWAPAHGSVRALDAAKARFAAAEGDAVTYLNVHRAWEQAGRAGRWAARHYLIAASLHKACEVRAQLLGHLRRQGLLQGGKAASCGQDMEPVLHALTRGLFMNAAVYERTEYNPLASEADPGVHMFRLVRYTAHRGSPLKLRIHNSSVLWRSVPPCVVYSMVQQTGAGWYEMQGVTAIKSEWLIQAAPHVYHRPGAHRDGALEGG